MSDVFISYSRKDKAFVLRLHEALRSQNRETWVDWDAIEWTEDWWNAIERGIEGANTFVFVISPDSIASEVCCDEIDYAVKHNKRLVPVVYREVAVPQVHESLQKLNWLFFRDQDPFEPTFAELITVVDTDLEHVRSHTRILQRAIEWEREGRDASFVLRGEDLVRSQAWLVQAEQQQPKPTELQREYVSASQTSEKEAAILLKAGQRAKRMVRFGSGVLVATLVGSGVAGIGAWKATDEAKAGTQIERAGSVALRRFDLDQAGGLWLAMKAGFELKKWVGNKSFKEYPALSPISALQFGLVRIRETKLPVNQGIVWSVAFSSDGTRIATGGDDGSIKLWNKDGNLVARIKTDQSSVWSVAFSPDSSRIATGGKDGSTKLWDKDGNFITTINSRHGSVRSVAFSPDGTRIATGGDDGSIKLWDKDGNSMASPIIGNQSIVRSIAFNPDGTRIATGGDDGSIKLWDKDGNLVARINGNQGIVRSIAFNPDGTRIATGGDDGSTKLWDKDGNSIARINGNQGIVWSVAFSPNANRVATGGVDGSIKLWDKDGRPIITLNSNQGIVRSVAFSPDGTRIATGGVDGSIKLWNKDGEAITTFNSNQDIVRSVAFSLSNEYIAIGRVSGSTQIWNTDGKLINTIKTQQGSIMSVAFSPDGNRIATGGRDGITKLWNTDGKFITTIKTQQDIVMSVAFSPDGNRIATGGANGSIKLWDRDGNPITTIKGNQGIVWSIAFNVDGSRIATGGDSSTKLWNTDGNLITTIHSDQGIIWSVSFNRNGKELATGGGDGSIKFWDKDEKLVGQFEEGYPSIISPDWQSVAIVTKPSYFGAPLPNSEDTIVQLRRVDLNLDSLLRRACQHLKPYILDDPNQKTEQAQCEKHLGENWEKERTSK